MKPKAIVHLGRNVQRGKRLVGYIYRDKAKVAIGGFLPGGVTGDPSQDYESLLMGHHGAGRLIRNVIISLNCPTTYEWIERHAAGLGRCADEFCERFAPDRPYVWAVHRNGAKLHCSGWSTPSFHSTKNSSGYSMSLSSPKSPSGCWRPSVCSAIPEAL